MSADKRHLSASFGRLSLIFAGILLLFVSLTASQTAEKLQREHERHLLKTLEFSLDPLIAATSDESYVFNRINSLVAAARNGGIDGTRLAEAVKTASDTFRVPVKAFFYQNMKLRRS
ncbi:MAG TPA: hypothetical protein PLR50_13985, partial [Candidatus Rifleibacterium sp.]|nr:hypothetical protein [Candidatus Rifleibacterium sp.]